MADFLKSIYNKANDVYEGTKPVLEPVADAYNTVQDTISAGKRKFTDALVDATNMMPQDLRNGEAYVQGQQDIKDTTGNLFDMATPDASSLIPVGKIAGAAGKVLGIEGKAAKIASKIPGMADDVAESIASKSGQTIEQLAKNIEEAKAARQALQKGATAEVEAAKKASNIRLAEPDDFKAGGYLLNSKKPVVEASKDVGKVITPDMAKQASKENIDLLLTQSPTGQKVLALKDENPALYNALKQRMIKKIHEFTNSRK